jgi:hypothetical protein
MRGKSLAARANLPTAQRPSSLSSACGRSKFRRNGRDGGERICRIGAGDGVFFTDRPATASLTTRFANGRLLAGRFHPVFRRLG